MPSSVCSPEEVECMGVNRSERHNVYCNKWLSSRVVYFMNGPSFSISRILISRTAAGDHIFVILARYFIFHELSLHQRNS